MNGFNSTQNTTRRLKRAMVFKIVSEYADRGNRTCSKPGHSKREIEGEEDSLVVAGMLAHWSTSSGKRFAAKDLECVSSQLLFCREQSSCT
jgi:hypothetical protein